MNHLNTLTIATFLTLTLTASAKIDLVTLPKRDTVQLTIYNSADLTLVRDSRQLTLTKGENALQFSWANTLIDPTSLDLTPLANANQIDILDLVFPPRIKDLGLWNINSEINGNVPMKIDYFTSGLSWRAFYMGVLSTDEKTMQLQGYVTVRNDSGEDYEDAQTRLIVGQIHLLDQIAKLARKQHPYGSPKMDHGRTSAAVPTQKRMRAMKNQMMAFDSFDREGVAMEEAKEIKKEGLSEYFLYTISGTETIPNGWSKRLPSFDTDAIPVKNLYKYDEQRYGPSPMRFLSFINDEKHQLGETPIPGGNITIYRTTDKQQHLSFEGGSWFKYIPVGEDVELQLGTTDEVLVEANMMDTTTHDYLFNNNRDIAGWIEDQTYAIDVSNSRNVPIRIEIKRHFSSQYWSIKNSGDFGSYEKVDLRSIKYTLEIPPRTKTKFEYVLSTRYGQQTTER